MSVIDCFTFNGEYDLLEIRLNVLKDHVNRFIIVEFDKTFSGKEKPFYFKQQRERFRGWPITYYSYHELFYEKYRELAESSPNTVGADHWKREFMQKECLKDALEHCKDADIVFIGDVDEIWDGTIWHTSTPVKLPLRVYSYYLNNRSSEQFWGTLVAPYKDIKNNCLNHLRSHEHSKNEVLCGWHFTSMGGYEEVKRKLSDSYTEDSYWNPSVQANLSENMTQNKDFLGRDFTYTLDESEWPRYLKESREKYKHLLK